MVRDPRISGNAVVVYADNYINNIEGEKLEEQCKGFLQSGTTRIVIDFSGTDMINSIGISILIGIIESVRSKKGLILFSGLKKINREIFDVVGLTKQVPVFASEHEAVELLREHAGSVIM